MIGTSENVVAHPRWVRVLVWVGFPVAGAVLGGLLSVGVDWMARWRWLPGHPVLEWVAALPEPHAGIGVLAVGGLVGLSLAALTVNDFVVVAVSPQRMTLTRGGGRGRVIDRAAVTAAFVDGKELVVLGRSGAELARESMDLPTDQLADTFRRSGIAWCDTDPYADAFRRWVPDDPALPAAANALLSARERALHEGDAHDLTELRDELARLGVVVRERRKRQYWRRFEIPAGRDG